MACSSSEPQVSNNTEQSSKQAVTVTAPMGPPDAQASFHAAHDLMTIAAIHNPAVKNNSSTEQMRAALGIPNDAKWKSLLANPQLACGPTDSFWVNFAAEIEQEWLATHVLAESKLR